MEPKRGRIENGAVVLTEPTDAPDGTEVMVLIDTRESVAVSDDELELIDAGLREAEAPARIDARSFLRALRSRR